MKTCKGCQFYFDNGTKGASCTRFPPQVVSFEEGNKITGYEIRFVSRYPRVHENTHRCGEFRALSDGQQE